MVKKLLKYTIFTIIIIFVIILFANYYNYNKINDDLNIQQSIHPNIKVIENMMKKKQPSVFIQEIQLWDGIDLLIGYDYENIK